MRKFVRKAIDFLLACHWQGRQDVKHNMNNYPKLIVIQNKFITDKNLIICVYLSKVKIFKKYEFSFGGYNQLLGVKV